MDKRIAKWDNIKGLLIILVVIGHFLESILGESRSYQSIFLFIYSFHMPAFLVIAGFFHRDSRYDAKTIYFLSLFVLVTVLIFFTNHIWGTAETIAFLSNNGLPWFLLVMAYCFLVTHFVRKARFGFILFIAAVMGIFVGYDSSIGDTLALSRFIVFYPFFLLGYMLHEKGVLENPSVRSFCSKPVIKIVCAVLLIVWLLLCFTELPVLYKLRPIFTGRNPYSVLTLSIEGATSRIICYFISLASIVFLTIFMPERKIPLLTHIGKKTLQIYLLHITVRNILFYYVDVHALIKNGNLLVKGLWLLVPVLVVILLSANFLTAPLDRMKAYCYGNRTADQPKN